MGSLGSSRPDNNRGEMSIVLTPNLSTHGYGVKFRFSQTEVSGTGLRKTINPCTEDMSSGSNNNRGKWKVF